MKTVCAFILTLIMAFNLAGQEAEVAMDMSLETKEDYKKAEPLVLACINWLQEAPLLEDEKRRNIENAFVLKWISGSPSVTVEVLEGIAPLDSPDCLMAFMSGWVKHSLENNYDNDRVRGALAGAKQAIDFYKKNKSEIGKNSDMEGLVKKEKSGKLEAFIASKFVD